jgi:hypothetical protein
MKFIALVIALLFSATPSFAYPVYGALTTFMYSNGSYELNVAPYESSPFHSTNFPPPFSLPGFSARGESLSRTPGGRGTVNGSSGRT